jgi:hypothetical protein
VAVAGVLVVQAVEAMVVAALVVAEQAAVAQEAADSVAAAWAQAAVLVARVVVASDVATVDPSVMAAGVAEHRLARAEAPQVMVAAAGGAVASVETMVGRTAMPCCKTPAQTTPHPARNSP